MPDQSLNPPPPDDEGASQPPRRDDDTANSGRPLHSGKLPQNPFNDFVNDHLDLTDLEGGSESPRARPSGNPFQLTGRPPFAASSHDVWNVDDDDEDDMFDFDDDDDDLDPTDRPTPFGSVFGAGPSVPPSGKKKNDPPPNRPTGGLFGGPPVPGKPSPFGPVPNPLPRPGAPSPRPGTPPRFMGLTLPRMGTPPEHDTRWKQMNFRLKSDLELIHVNSVFGVMPRVTVIPQAERLLKNRFFVIQAIEPGWIAVKVLLDKRPALIGFVRAETVTLLEMERSWSKLLLSPITFRVSPIDLVMVLGGVVVVLSLISMLLTPTADPLVMQTTLTELQTQVQAQAEQLRQLEALINQLRP